MSTPHPGTRQRLSAAALAGSAALGLAVLSACGGVASDASSSTASDATQTETAAPQTGESSPEAEPTPDQELPGLSSEQMVEVLISPSDLPAVPAGHATHSGADYFHEEIAVEFQDYKDRFGPSECTTAMDSINVDLVGEGADEGLMHTYRFADEGEQTGLLYVWMLAYDRPVDTAPVWDGIDEHCSQTQLQNGTDSVDVHSFDVGEFSGLQLGIHRGSQGSEEEFTTFSASMDVGENLLMMSSVGLDEASFDDIVQTQQQKVEEFSRTELAPDQD